MFIAVKKVSCIFERVSRLGLNEMSGRESLSELFNALYLAGPNNCLILSVGLFSSICASAPSDCKLSFVASEFRSSSIYFTILQW